jgi:hypothetical protein
VTTTGIECLVNTRQVRYGVNPAGVYTFNDSCRSHVRFEALTVVETTTLMSWLVMSRRGLDGRFHGFGGTTVSTRS